MQSSLPGAWSQFWKPDHLVGMGSGQAWFNPTSFWMWLWPPSVFVNWIYALGALGAGVFFYLFLREKRLSLLAALFGAVTYCYGSVNFSLAYAGHIGKFGCYLWFAATLWALECSLRRSRPWSWRVLAGAFLGLAVAEQPDLAILFVWLFVVVVAFQAWNEPEAKFEKAVTRFVGLVAFYGIVSGLIAANVVLSQYRSQVQDVVETSRENKLHAWEWATQWSYPPEDTLELVAPGFFGWRISEPSGPYWGRVGRSPGYDETKQGFARFKLDNTYLGIVPIFLAVAVVMYAFHRRYRECFPPATRKEIVFWAVVAVVTLLLAFGKFFLLYHFFYAIPKMNIIRNPIKFLHLFSVAIAVLSAHGFQCLIEERDKRLDVSWLWKILAGITAVAVLGAFYISSSQQKLVAGFAQEFQTAGPVIVSNMTNALIRLALSSGIFAVLCLWLIRPASVPAALKAWIPRLVLLLAAVDLYLTNRHYVTYYDYNVIYAQNHLIQFLKNDPDPYRVKILPRDQNAPFFSLYNQWLTFNFPYSRIQSFDSPQTPRVPVDYDRYFEALRTSPLRMWQLTDCKYLLGPAEYWAALQQDPLLRPHMTLAYAYELVQSNKYIVTAPLTGTLATPTTQVVIRYDAALPRVKFYDRWRTMPDDTQCLRTLASPQFDPAAVVIVSDPIPPQTNSPPVTAPAKVEWLKRTDNVALLRVTTDRQGVLLFNEKYDPDFVLTVDGKPSPLLRCNFIMKGALVEPGTHEVRFEYRPPAIGFYVSVSAWVLCLFVVLVLRVIEKKAPA